MNDSSDTRNGRKDLGICCYYRVFALAMKRYSSVPKLGLDSCKCLLQTLEQ